MKLLGSTMTTNYKIQWKVQKSQWVSVLLTGAVGWLTLQGHDLVFLLVCLHRQVGQVLLHLSCHLSVFVQLLGVEKRAATYSLLVGAALHVQHVGVCAALTQWPDDGKSDRGRKREENDEEKQRWDEEKQSKIRPTGCGGNFKRSEKWKKCWWMSRR